MLFDYGLELDEVTNERIALEKERGDKKKVKADEDVCEEDVYKIELPANRYDLLSVEGLSRALRIFLSEINQPKYELLKGRNNKNEMIIVKAETKEVRPYVVGAILRNVKLDQDSYASFIDLQDKLHQNICRKRTLVAIGTHDLDTVQGPFYYGAEKPNEIRFKPLNETKEFTAEELMVHYSNESHLKPYLPIIAGKERYPVIRDSNGIVLSMPPIINGEHSKIHLGTRNIFIEATATDLQKAVIVLDTVVTLFSQYCEKPFTVEAVDVKDVNGNIVQYPELAYHHQEVNVARINTKIGLKLDAKEMSQLLTRMSLTANISEKDNQTIDIGLLMIRLTMLVIMMVTITVIMIMILMKVKVIVPPTRHDILHECDIAEDVAIAYGFNRIQHQLPKEHTIAEAFDLNKLSDLLRHEVANAGWTEVLNFALCSSDDVSTKLCKANGLESAVKIANPKTIEFQVARTSLFPGLLKTIASNKDMPLPLKLFELQDVVIKDQNSEVGARNERRLAAIFYSKSSGFEKIHGLVDRVMQLLSVKWLAGEDGYRYEPIEDTTYLDGRCAAIMIGSKEIGRMGVLNPDVLNAFALTLPVSAFELNIEPGQAEEKRIVKDVYGLFVDNFYCGLYSIAEADRLAKRKIEREEERLKATNRDMSMFKMKSMLAIGFAFTALLSTFSSLFEGRVVAKLPFTPISWIQGLSHRNLLGDDHTDCSFIFLYILCTMTIRQNLQKALGFAPSRAMNRQSQPNFFGTSNNVSPNFSYLR
ncbi:unnamed protein product [Anisakis simplex]|uniref:Phenylalanine--tRNA ligase beta subunit n=1 Tax=Anisakis simplex TaxID=6269 RepID=A0A3P6NP85_ANISI|nr:unnamed protein product [Anisakis simplex]